MLLKVLVESNLKVSRVGVLNIKVCFVLSPANLKKPSAGIKLEANWAEAEYSYPPFITGISLDPVYLGTVPPSAWFTKNGPKKVPSGAVRPVKILYAKFLDPDKKFLAFVDQVTGSLPVEPLP